MRASLSVVYSHSELETFRRCPRLHLFKYILLRRPISVAEPLQLGTLVHRGQEAWLKSLMSPNGVDPLELALTAIATMAEKKRCDALLRVQAEELMLGYHCRWIDEDIEVLAVEEEFECDAVEPILGTPVGRLGGKMDSVLLISGDQYLHERKTTSFEFDAGSYGGQHYWERTRLSAQLGLYFVGARAKEYAPTGIIYDVVGKPKSLEPLRATPVEKRKFTKSGILYKGQSEVDEDPEVYRKRLRAAIQEQPEIFYARRQVVRLASEVDAAVADMAATIEMIEHCRRLGIHPRNVDACWQFNRRCEYFGVCSGEESIRDDLKFRTSIRHEELSK